MSDTIRHPDGKCRECGERVHATARGGIICANGHGGQR